MKTLKQNKDDAVRLRHRMAHETLFRHVVTVIVDTAERSARRVQDTVQAALDEHTSCIQPVDVVDFVAAEAVSTTRIESTQATPEPCDASGDASKETP